MPVTIYPTPSGAKPSPDYRVEVNGHPVFTTAFAAGSYASFETDEPVEVAVYPPRPSAEVPIVRPLRSGILPESRPDGSYSLHLPGPGQFYLDFPVGPPLMLFANPPEGERPDPSDPNVHYFRAGRTYDVGGLELHSNQTLYIEGGAVVKGHVHAHNAENIRIAGPGVLDGRHYAKGSHRLIVFDGCTNVTVEDVCTVGTPSWNLVFGACEEVRVRGIKLIGWVVTSDGIDIVGSRRVHVRDSFFRCNDDCIAVKALTTSSGLEWSRDVSDVLVENCILFNDKAGNAMEIGYETRTERISNITFRNIDVIGAHGEGGVFTIHNGDRACIENVLYEDVRVEHYYDKLVDFRILESRYSKDTERGHVRGIRLRNIQCTTDVFNCVSLIGGFNASHRIEDVSFEAFHIGGRKVLGADALHLFERHARGIKFEP